MATVESRLIALEASNRRWRLLALVACTLVTVMMTGGEAAPKDAALTTRKLQIVDDHGQARIELFTEGDLAVIGMYGQDGKIRGGWSMTNSGTHLFLKDPKTNREISTLLSNDGQMSFSLDDPVSGCNADVTQHSISLFGNHQSHVTISGGNTPGRGFLSITPPDNKASATIGLEELGGTTRPFVHLFGVDGKSVPVTQ